MRRIVGLLLILVSLSPTIGAAQSRAPRDAAGLVAVASAAMEERRYADAFEAFTSAAAMAPRDASLCVGAGIAAFMVGQLADAKTWLERALKLEPRFTEASLVLGTVLYRQGNVSEAIKVYEAALTHAPNDARLKDELEQWRQESDLHGRFYQSQGAHFSVFFEGPADDVLARRVVEVLEAAYYRIGTTLTTYPTETITVLLYTREQFRDITRTPAWAAGVYDGRIKVPALGAFEHWQDLQRVLEHELVHAMVANLAGLTVPTWINEGLAIALEPGGADWATTQLQRYQNRIPYSELSRGFGRMTAADARMAYAQSAVAIKKMIDLRGAPAVVALLQALGRGTPFETAFQQTIFMRYEDFAASLAHE